MPIVRGRHPPWAKWYDLPRWRRLRARQLLREPWCVMCEARGFPGVVATAVDHVEPHHGDRTEFFLGTLQSLCKPCHDSVKRGIELRGFDAALMDEQGWPSDPRHPANDRSTAPGRAQAKGR